MNQILNPANYYFNLYAIPPLIVGFTMFLLGLFVFLQNRKSVNNFSFFLLMLIASIWLFGSSLTCFAKNEWTMQFWYRYMSIGMAFVAPCIYFFATALSGKLKRQKIFVLTSFLISFVFFILATRDFFIAEIHKEYWAYVATWGPQSYPFIAFFSVLAIVSLLNLIFSYKKEKELIRKRQLKIMIIAFLLIYLAMVDFGSAFGIKIYPLGFIPAFIFSVITAYAIIRYRLMLITPALAADAVITALTDSLILVNPEGKIVLVNRATSDLLGYEKEELVGKSIDSLAKGKPVFKELIKEEIIRDYEISYSTKSGERIPVSLSSTLIRDKTGGLTGVVVITHDIRETKRLITQLAEKIEGLESFSQEVEKARLATLNILEDVEETRGELTKEKERIENIILSFVDGLLVLKDSEVLLLNPSAEGILGIEAKDIIGKSLNLLSKYSNIKILSQFLKENKKRPLIREEIIFPKPERTFQITAIAIAASQDLIILHDVSREKLIEQMKTEFVSLAAHQLRTPLSAIKWTLRMILDGDVGKITKGQRNFLEKTYQSNERMIGLINDLLNVARIEEGRYLYKLVPAQIEDIIQSVINPYKEEIKRKKIIFEFKKPKKKLPKIKVDVEKINLAIQNLLDNTIKYTRPGGRVTVSLKGGIKEIELGVTDTGVGIPEDQQERVFSKFFRGANVIRLETEGAGLGLFITKNIIEAHGGKIWFESEENKGTTFYFTLPVKKT